MTRQKHGTCEQKHGAIQQPQPCSVTAMGGRTVLCLPLQTLSPKPQGSQQNEPQYVFGAFDRAVAQHCLLSNDLSVLYRSPPYASHHAKSADSMCGQTALDEGLDDDPPGQHHLLLWYSPHMDSSHCISARSTPSDGEAILP
ncbi:hypothetical protein AC1031_005910 [Aphanomyces cochlioides]|nr:hypothetical protein AC1031_005910 [Aphanomyces cochlioides]